MKIANIKSSSTASKSIQAKQQPFFNKEGEGSFFSKSSEPATSFFNPATIQPKLTIGQPNDKYEMEADSMADKVVQRLAMAHAERPPVGDAGSRSTLGGNTGVQTVQPKCTECAEEENLQRKQESLISGITKIHRKPIFESIAEQHEANVQTKPVGPAMIQAKCDACVAKEENIQTKSEGTSGKASSDLHSRLNSNRGGGNPLSPDVQKNMGSAFGSDFSTVRIHTGREAVQMNKDLNAQAFTHGSDIYFNQGKYDTDSTSGKHLLAHELTHTVQQGKGNMLQKQPSATGVKEHGDISQIPSDVRGTCNIATTSPASEQIVPYTHNSSRLTPRASRILNEFAREWHHRGANANVRIDGYASTEGGERLNWRLSCSRARTVKNALLTPSDGTTGVPVGFIDINAHGETDRFSQTTLSPNRLATITSSIPVNPNPPTPTPTPTPNPTEENKICGPDVSGEVARVWRQIQTDFGSWDFGQKESACRYLIQPIIIDPSTGDLGLNKDAFDTLGLFLNTAGWTQRPPYHPPCGVPGSTGNPCDNRDPGHENPNTCSNTVQIGSGCWLTGTANYGTYGVMMKLCNDWINSPLARFLVPHLLRQAFSYTAMVSLITAYKIYDQENPAWPIAWSSATYLGGPGSSPPGGNRPDCLPTCSVPFTTPPFDYVWEPTRARGAISPIYEYPCTASP